MQEISQTGPLADVGSARLYLTSGLTPTEVLPDTFANDTVLKLYISEQNPLMVRDLVISAQWTPAEDADYRVKLTENLTKTSNYFHDFTDGQFALGNITVYQNYDKWNEADVRLYASNNLRPLAVVGGIVEDVTADVSSVIPLTYASGEIYMGSQWNRYFEPPSDKDIPDEEKENIKDDWALAFGHELGHYTLFLWDTYFGIVDVPPTGDEDPADNPKKKVEEVDGCTGSAMGYLYDLDNTEFIFDAAHWMTNCSITHAYSQTNGLRTEWDTIQAWYPWAIQPTQVMTNTPAPPIDLTTINFNLPSNSVTTLFTQTFDLLYESPVVTQTFGASDRARGYIIRGGNRIIEQGQPPEASRSITLTGAAEEDRFCLFDIKNVGINTDGKSLFGESADPDTTLRHQFGCKELDTAENEEYELDLERDVSWEPVIEIDYADEPPDPPESEDEVTIRVGLDDGPLNLKARIYPEHEAAPTESEIFAHDPKSKTYSTTVTLPKFTPSLYVQLWATDDDGNVTETTPRREAIVGSGVKGAVFPGPAQFAGGAPIISPDGDFIVTFNETINLGVGEFIAIQETYAIPTLPTNTIPLNNITGYRLTARPNSLITDGIVSLRYLPSPSSGPLNAASAAEEQVDLTIYQWDGKSWNALETELVTEPNGYILATAQIEEGGIYALLENVIPNFEQVAYLPFIVR